MAPSRPLTSERFSELLLAGDEAEAERVVQASVSEGAGAADVYLEVLGPALHRVGAEWEHGRASVAAEHRATEIAVGIMARLSKHFHRGRPRRGTAITLTPPQETHGVGARMVADFLHAGGFEVHHLGPNVPLPDLALFLQVVASDVVCVSVTVPGLDVSLYGELVRACRRAQPDVLVVFGGQGVHTEAAEAAGGVVMGELADLVDRLDALLADRAARPYASAAGERPASR